MRVQSVSVRDIDKPLLMPSKVSTQSPAGLPFVEISIQSSAETALAGWPPFLLDLSLVGGRHLTNLTIH
jgi:hypothetical protein